jgi:homoaconitase/3-isopropylmalate dehydratase large subunit
MELEGSGTSPYSPDRSLLYCGFFQKVKEPSCGICFRMIVDILGAVERAVTDISRKYTTDGVGQLPHM